MFYQDTDFDVAASCDGLFADKKIHVTHISEIESAMFTDGATITDVHQNVLGSCWLLSAIIAVVNCDKDYFQSKISYDDDWKVVIQFANEEIIIDGYIPCIEENGQMKPISACPQDEAWIPLLCKGVVKYLSLHPDNITSQKMKKLGLAQGVPHYEYINGGTPDMFWNPMIGGESKILYTCPQIHQVMVQSGVSNTAMVGLSRGKTDRQIVNGIVCNHAYAILGLYRIAGEQVLKIQNPWQKCEPSNKFSRYCEADDGMFFMSLAEYSFYFPHTVFCSL